MYLILNMIPFTIEYTPFTVWPLIALLMVNANALNRSIGFDNPVWGMNSKISIMGEPLLPDRVFDFPVDELEPHPAYDFFAPAPLPGYADNPNNHNGWLEADDYLLGELEAMVDEPMVIPAIEEVVKPVAVAEEEQVIAPVVDMEEDLAALFGDDDFEDDASDGFDMEEV
ncbi:hypothetical protein Tco_1284370 [Tanacetum coccineum]